MFYHHTSPAHLSSILADKVIRPTESNVGSPLSCHTPHGPNFGPDVVWLLDTPDLDFPHGLTIPQLDITQPFMFDKRKAWIQVEVPAIRWLDWAPAQRMDREWRTILVDGGGGPEAAEHWWLWPNPIYSSRFREHKVRED